MKKSCTGILFVFLICSGLFYGLPLVLSQSGTQVSGIISQDTTWTKTGSPYNLTANVLVNSGVTLTITPGVTVNLNSFYLMVDGTLVSKGSSTDRVTFNGGSLNYPTGITLTASATGWNEQAGTGSIIENTVLNTTVTVKCNVKIVNNLGYRSIDIIDASPLVTDNTLGSLSICGSPAISNNVIQGRIYISAGSPTVTKNTIKAAVGTDWIGRPSYFPHAVAISGGNPLISDNTIVTFVDESAVYIAGGSPTIQNNVISNTYGFGNTPVYWQSAINLEAGTNVLIQNNTIFNSPVGIAIQTDSFTLTNNNFKGNQYHAYIYSTVTSDVNVPNNWWGTTDTQAINQKIYDYHDDFTLHKINYMPSLTSANSQAPPIPLPTPNPITNPTPTTTVTQNPTANPTASPNMDTQQTPKATQSNSENPIQASFDVLQIAIFTVLTLIAVALVAIAVLLYRKNKLQAAALK